MLKIGLGPAQHLEVLKWLLCNERVLHTGLKHQAVTTWLRDDKK
jgi:hypothetical protein